ncbi:efflux RND transporter periplasmic adaptor subunit [Shewanella intestini]|uniref:Efflux RND transporter periplasmic adaptor subunit n=1 Tax=Shewanella intestini TaxID=2017544 RepID=A0ABS5I417_9GAMM|nr:MULTISPECIES: efflux RND transporter periplasmic adaptor subunit [Shewanella]MBR9728782.1 efflux RND transporter periplasmic adaptor subunit [Shewanella intestini]MRG36857.1 efflux RND transporter periplasmic adaptor subunit [Shewanella sp. XMDDZSB0408]
MKCLSLPLSILVLSLLITGCHSEPEKQAEMVIRPVKLITVSDISTQPTRAFPAKVAATKQADLAFRVPGHLVNFNLFEGQLVSKGSVLASLDDRDAKNALLSREADYDLAEADFTRKGALLKKALISPAEYDASKAQLKSARANLANAKDQLSYTQLKAPYDGTIAKIALDNYQMVQANQTILTIQKNNTIDVVIQVPESLVNSISQLQLSTINAAQVYFANSPDTAYAIRLKEHATQVTPGTQTYEAVFTLPRPQKLMVLPGMSAEVKLHINEPSPVSAVVPTSALVKRDSDGKTIVWVFNPTTSTVTERIVNIGNVTTNGIEIIEGVTKGEQIVVAGVQYLSANQTVKPLHWQRGV